MRFPRLPASAPLGEAKSSGEWVDVVDENDRVVGRATRADVRAGNLRHRACYVLVRDDEGRHFIHQRTATKDVFPSYYDMMAGGVLAAGESYAIAASREVGEELGVPALDLREVGGLVYEDATNRVVGRVFECRVVPPLRLQLEEIVGGEWVTADALERMLQQRDFCPDSVVAFEVWRRQRGG